MSRKLLYIILVPAVLLIAGYLYVRFSMQTAISREEERTGEKLSTTDTLGGEKTSALDLRPLFIKRVQQLLKKSSNGLYNLSVGDLQTDLTASKLVLEKIKMEPDAAKLDSLRKTGEAPNDIYTISFDRLEVEGINLDDAITSKTMDYESVKLVNPVIVIHHQKKTDKQPKEDFSQRFLKEIEKLSVKQLVIENGDVTIYNSTKKGPPNKLKQVSVVLNDILLDSSARNDKDRFLFAKEATISFRDFVKPTPDGLYQLKLQQVTAKAPQQQVIINGLSFTSPLSKTEFVKRASQSKELYNLTLSSVTLSGVDWWSLLNEEEITAGNISIPGGKLSIFLDRSLPPRNKMGNFPNQLLKKIPVKMNVNRLSINNLDLSYTEYNPVSKQEGTVFMDNVNLTASNVSNTGSKPISVNGTALFMHKIPVTANFVFDMANHRSGKFSATIKAGEFEGALLNSFAMPMGLMKVEKGTVQRIEATMSGNQHKTNGEALLLYKDLKLTLLEKDKGKAALDKKDFTTFIANLLVIKNENPKGNNAPRREKASFTRDPNGGFFMLVWKTILVGVLKTIGAPEKMAYKTVADAKKK